MTKKVTNSKEQVKYLILITTGLLVLLLFLDVFSLGADVFGLKRKQTISIDHVAELVVRFPDGKTKAFSGEVVKDMTILDALAAVSQSGGLQPDYLIDGGRLKFISINGINYSETKPWKFVLNGRPVGIEKINTIGISGGDVIEVTLNATK